MDAFGHVFEDARIRFFEQVGMDRRRRGPARAAGGQGRRAVGGEGVVVWYDYEAQRCATDRAEEPRA